MISDDDLLLYYYRDGLDAAERARIGAALSEQPELAAATASSRCATRRCRGQPEVPVPAHVQQRWQAALERAAAIDEQVRTRAPAGSSDFRWPVAAAACGRRALS